ncbi:MAG: Mur ligase [Gemmatimonadetes bacterium]|nr:Mur ligase [Gemmatimonadota bacterium]
MGTAGVPGPAATDAIPEFPSPRIADSRRLMGPHLHAAVEGAVLDVVLPADAAQAAALLDAWCARVRELSARLGWPEPEVVVRRQAHEASCFASAPADRLMAATERGELAWTWAEADVGERAEFDTVAAVARVRAVAEPEVAARRHLPAVLAEAARRGLTVTYDDDSCAVGSGDGARTYAWADLPAPADLPWAALHDVPVALVTGSNGKTTTVRLLAAMWRAAGRVPGWCSTTGVQIGEHVITEGDWSGPAGARAVLRDPRVQAAVLETARGGILRRGLATRRADVAVITNLQADHLGEYGIATLEALGAVKAVTARALVPRGALVLNAEDPALVALAPTLGAPVAWFALDPAAVAAPPAGVTARGACVVRDSVVEWRDAEGGVTPLALVADVPIAFGGAAPHMVANACAAAAAAMVLGIPVAAVRAALRAFGANAGDNPGRLTVHRLPGGVTALVDYAHNPAGVATLGPVVARLGGARKLIVLGQAGNRDDEAVRGLVRAAWATGPYDRVIIKDLPMHRKGRRPGEMTALIADELARLGVPAAAVQVSPSERAAVEAAVAWGTPGDLLVLPLHAQATELSAWLAGLAGAS